MSLIWPLGLQNGVDVPTADDLEALDEKLESKAAQIDDVAAYQVLGKATVGSPTGGIAIGTSRVLGRRGSGIEDIPAMGQIYPYTPVVSNESDIETGSTILYASFSLFDQIMRVDFCISMETLVAGTKSFNLSLPFGRENFSDFDQASGLVSAMRADASGVPGEIYSGSSTELLVVRWNTDIVGSVTWKVRGSCAMING